MGFRSILVRLFSARQTYSLIFLWVLTWFLYGIFMKGQVNVLNILGAASSAVLIGLSYFLPFPIAITAKKPVMPQTKKITLPQTQIDSPVTSKLSIASPSRTSPCANQVKKSPRQVTSPYRQEQKPQPLKLSEEPQESPKSNGCPKNLDYFTMRPRPKVAPDECITCENLITCVCLTSS